MTSTVNIELELLKAAEPCENAEPIKVPIEKTLSLIGTVFPPGGVNVVLEALLYKGALLLRLNPTGGIEVHAGIQFEPDIPLGFVTGAVYFTDSAESSKQHGFKLPLDHGIVVHVNECSKNILGYIGFTNQIQDVNVVFIATGAAYTSKRIKVGRAMLAYCDEEVSAVSVSDIVPFNTPEELLLKKGLFARSQADFDAQKLQVLPILNMAYSLSYAMTRTSGLFYRVHNEGDNSVPCIIGKDQTFVCKGESLLVPAYVPTTSLSSELDLSLVATFEVTAEKVREILDSLQVTSVQELDVCPVATEIFPPWKEYIVKEMGTHQKDQHLSSRTRRAPHAFVYNTGRDIIPIVCTVRASNIHGAGMGLFATEDIGLNGFVTWYGGHLYHKDEFNALPDSRKTFSMSVLHDTAGIYDYIIDGQYGFGSSLGRFINFPTKPMKANVHPVWVTTNKTGECPAGYIAIKATREIVKNDEIFMAYGKGYVKSW
jgi:hypothetical protein